MLSMKLRDLHSGNELRLPTAACAAMLCVVATMLLVVATMSIPPMQPCSDRSQERLWTCSR